MTAERHRLPGWLPVVLVALILAVYTPSLRAPFHFDDLGAVETNPTIRTLFSWDVLRPPADGSTTTGRPLLNLSYAINYALSGESVFGYHTGNLVIHIIAALLLMGIVRRTLEISLSPRIDIQNVSSSLASPGVLAFAVATIWALHPLQTETVVGIAQRSEALCSLLYLLTLYTFIRAVAPGPTSAAGERDRARVPSLILGVSGLACLAGMAAKEVMVTAPIVVLLYDRTFIAGTFAGALRKRSIYYAALAATWVLLGYLVIRGAGARGASAGVGLGVSSWDYLLTQARALIIYLKLSFWPHPLVLDYGTAVDRSLADVWWQGLTVLTLLGAVLWSLVRRPVIGFVGAVFFLVLAPSSSVVPLVTQTIAEHRMYLPLTAVVVLIVVGTQRLFPRRGIWLLLAVTGGLVVLTVARTRDYADVLALWQDTVAKYPASARAHNNLALELDRRGRAAEAWPEFAQALAIDPNYVSAYYNFGSSLLAQGRTAEAIEKLQAAVALAPSHGDAQLALGNALTRAGSPAAAVPHYQAALAASPGADVHYNLAVALSAAGRDSEAEAQLHAALNLRPDFPEAHYQLALIAERAGEGARAAQQLEETLKYLPNHAGAHRRLGLRAARAGDFAAAGAHFEAIVRDHPEDADALANLGNTWLARERPREAIEYYERVLRLRPDDQRAQENLRLARAALREP